MVAKSTDTKKPSAPPMRGVTSASNGVRLEEHITLRFAAIARVEKDAAAPGRAVRMSAASQEFTQYNLSVSQQASGFVGEAAKGGDYYFDVDLRFESVEGKGIEPCVVEFGIGGEPESLRAFFTAVASVREQMQAAGFDV